LPTVYACESSNHFQQNHFLHISPITLSSQKEPISLMKASFYSILLFLLVNAPVSGVIYSTGTHVISSNLNDSLIIEGDADVTFTDGAKAFDIEVRDSAVFSMSAGEIATSLNAFGGHTYISGGTFNTAGVLTSGVFASDYAYVRFEGASVAVISASTDLLNSLPGQNPVIDFYGGTVTSGVWTQEQGVVNIFGGTLNVSETGLNSDGHINIYGGVFGLGSYISGGSWDGGNMNIYGSTFNYPFGIIPDTSGTVSGTLSDGNLVSLTFLDEDLSVGRRTATIDLKAVPEPGTFALLASGAIFALVLGGRRKS